MVLAQLFKEDVFTVKKKERALNGCSSVLVAYNLAGQQLQEPFNSHNVPLWYISSPF